MITVQNQEVEMHTLQRMDKRREKTASNTCERSFYQWLRKPFIEKDERSCCGGDGTIGERGDGADEGGVDVGGGF